MPDAFISLGSNAPDAERQLAAARKALDGYASGRIAAESSVYRTEPQGYKSQPWFANQVLRMECLRSATPEDLLRFMLEQERALGRVRDPANRFGPRVIDMDLLLFGGEARRMEFLELPHPRMAERAFVLVPLLEVAPGIVLPDGRRASDLLAGLEFRVEGSNIFQ